MILRSTTAILRAALLIFPERSRRTRETIDSNFVPPLMDCQTQLLKRSSENFLDGMFLKIARLAHFVNLCSRIVQLMLFRLAHFVNLCSRIVRQYIKIQKGHTKRFLQKTKKYILRTHLIGSF